jgi:lipoprotein signal peptidase
MLNPLKWERVDQLRLLFAVAFGAALGFFNGYSHGWVNLLWGLIGAVLVGGWFYYYRASR